MPRPRALTRGQQKPRQQGPQGPKSAGRTLPCRWEELWPQTGGRAPPRHFSCYLPNTWPHIQARWWVVQGRVEKPKPLFFPQDQRGNQQAGVVHQEMGSGKQLYLQSECRECTFFPFLGVKCRGGDDRENVLGILDFYPMKFWKRISLIPKLYINSMWHHVSC